MKNAGQSCFLGWLSFRKFRVNFSATIKTIKSASKLSPTIVTALQKSSNNSKSSNNYIYYYVYIYPKAHSNNREERAKRVTNAKEKQHLTNNRPPIELPALRSANSHPDQQPHKQDQSASFDFAPLPLCKTSTMPVINMSGVLEN